MRACACVLPFRLIVFSSQLPLPPQVPADMTIIVAALHEWVAASPVLTLTLILSMRASPSPQVWFLWQPHLHGLLLQVLQGVGARCPETASTKQPGEGSIWWRYGGVREWGMWGGRWVCSAQLQLNTGRGTVRMRWGTSQCCGGCRPCSW